MSVFNAMADGGKGMINIAGVFNKEDPDQFDKEVLGGFIDDELDKKGVLHGGALTLDPESDKVIVQVKLQKTTVSKGVIDDVDELFGRLDDHIDTWVLSESVMHHPEIYK